MMTARPVFAQDPDQHAHGVDTRGDKGMGFSHDMVAHHFGLTKTGGFIAHIADAFKAGDFSLPLFIHDRVPPGVPEMKKLKAEIEYDFHETPQGGRIDITTANPKALRAVHQFLAFQTKDHRTGDSSAVAP
jgi:hypothetical protein